MLAQNYMAAADLGVADDIHGALISVLRMLERGEFVHQLPNTEARWEPASPLGFNMGCSGEQTECGTVACIGGWVAKLTGRGMNDYVNYADHPPELRTLYWRVTDYDIAPSVAASALRNYLTTGKANWEDVLANS